MYKKMLIRFNKWCDFNRISLNLNKYQISFSKKTTPIILIFNYNLCNYVLLRYSLIKYHGISFDSKIVCTDHIISTKNKALSMFGCVMRNYLKLNDLLHLNVFVLYS